MRRTCRVAMVLVLPLLWSLGVSAGSAVAGRVVITDVRDAALRDRAFAEWNFGAGPLLEAGFLGGIYETHHAASLLRFELSQSGVTRVQAATLRLYKPKSFVQMMPVDVRVYDVPTSVQWAEGAGVCEADADGASWARHSRAHADRPIARQTVGDAKGEWVEFALPASLVQRWVDHPDANRGVYLDAALKHDDEWGEHVFFHAREHWAGKGPELVIEGEVSPAGGQASSAPLPAPSAAVYRLPPADAAFERWLASTKRLAKFAAACDMNREQARLFYFFDTILRTRLIQDRYQKPLYATFDRLERLSRHGDERAVRRELAQVLKFLLVWEYIRETSWYTAGPTADVLSPLQLGQLFGDEIYGRMREAAREKGKSIWESIDDANVAEHARRSMAKLGTELELSQQAFDALAVPLARYEQLEHQNLTRFVKELGDVQARVAQRDDSAGMLQAVRTMETEHERFLYYQSIYNTPRWTLLTQFAPPIPLAKKAVEGRRAHYERQLGKPGSYVDEDAE